MLEDGASRLAILQYSPGVDLAGHRALLLAEDGIECQLLGAEDAAGELRQLPVLYVVAASWWNAQAALHREMLLQGLRRFSSATIVAGRQGEEIPHDLEDQVLTAWLDMPISRPALRCALRCALRSIKQRLDLAEAQRQLQKSTREMRELHRVGMALSSERDLDTLQRLILTTSREMTNADAGSLYLVEEDEDKKRVLVFHVVQNDSVEIPHRRQVVPMNMRSASGYAACTGRVVRLDDVYHLPPDVEYSHSPVFDQMYGYRTRSMLVVPMRNHYGEVVGVIQLINRKRRFAAILKDLETVAREVVPFTAEDEELLSSFASQAAVALDNKKLLDNIQKLFAGFIRASVKAIELRDPATRGHSDRVARLTMGLARTINDVHTGRWRDLHFTDEQLTEIEYAGLLHDFGKVGVREHVLVKPKKLFEWKLAQIRSRFQYARKDIQHRYTQHKLEILLAQGPDAYHLQEGLLDAECLAELAGIDGALQEVLAANEPSILPEGRFETLLELGTRRLLLPTGEEIPLLTQDELHNLTIRKGTLDDAEREEINSHVTHTFNFLIEIPWTREFRNVPSIAYAHHEKLNGSGYPRKLRSDEIPIQAKMMTISDIFDALAAQDRPYKPPVPLAKALDILGFEARDGNIDPDLLDLFITREVYRVIDPGASIGGLIAAGS